MSAEFWMILCQPYFCLTFFVMIELLYNRINLLLLTLINLNPNQIPLFFYAIISDDYFSYVIILIRLLLRLLSYILFPFLLLITGVRWNPSLWPKGESISDPKGRAWFAKAGVSLFLFLFFFLCAYEHVCVC
jgi:hypothetical protein